jgi:soluble lytic murein transglycosylase-like protein
MPALAGGTPALKAQVKTYLEVLEKQQARYGTQSDLLGCTHLSHYLEWAYATYTQHPILYHLSPSSGESQARLAFPIGKVISSCLKRHPSLTADPTLKRHGFLLAALEPDTELALKTFLETFGAFSPTHYAQLTQLSQDFKKISSSLGLLQNHHSLKEAGEWVQAVTQPDTFLLKIKKYVSPFFFHYVSAKVWTMHFNYANAFRSLSTLLDQFYLNDPPLQIASSLRPVELEVLEASQKLSPLLNSPRPVLTQMEWLARRLNTPQTYQTLDTYRQRHTQSLPSETAKTAAAKAQLQVWNERAKVVRRLWNQDQTETTLTQAKALIAEIQLAPLKHRKQVETGALVGNLKLIVASAYEASGQWEESLKWFESARSQCEDWRSDCYLSYHRNLLYLLLTHKRQDPADKLLTTLIQSQRLDPIEKQEFYFWKWWLSRQDSPKKTFDYDFPYLTIYRSFVTCFQNQELKTAMLPPNHPQASSPNPVFDPHDLKPLISAPKVALLRELMNHQPTFRSESKNRLFSGAALALLHKHTTNSSPILKQAKMRAFLKELTKHQLFEYAISILYHWVKQTPLSNMDPELLKLYFPLEFHSQIRDIALKYQVPDSLVVSVIRRESIFNPEATSPAHALGLMQVLPETAQRVAKSHSIPFSHVSNGSLTLYDPTSNILFGTLYVKSLLEKHHQDWIQSLASYNAGEHKVQTWTKRFGGLNPLLFLERIPYTETRLYVKWILLYHLFYTLLYMPDQTQAMQETFCRWVTGEVGTESAFFISRFGSL